MPKQIRVAPSILAADFARLGEDVRTVTEAGCDMIHVDVMDGRFVPNLTIGPAVVRAIRPHSTLPFDVHLMIEHPESLLPAFAEAGADMITVHVEACPHLHGTIQQLHSLGKKAGVALNPATPASSIAPVIGDIDLVLVMTVNPGYGGQSFIESQLDKLAQVRAMIDREGADHPGRAIDLSVDGGINADTAPRAVAAGADLLVAGTAVFGSGPERYGESIRKLRG